MTKKYKKGVKEINSKRNEQPAKVRLTPRRAYPENPIRSKNIPTCVGKSINIFIGCLREGFEEIGAIPEQGEYVICLEKPD